MSAGQQTVEEIVEGVRAGVPAAVARAISWCEQGGSRAEELLADLPARQAHVIGITGAPGAGKSTLLNQVLTSLRERDISVGVVAVDPSSPLTGGALLGDRIRLEGFTGDRGVFFRSLASRGAAGGLSDATRAASTILSAAGFDRVIIETVGAGQAEVEIMRVADTVLVVLIPGAGDEVQALKAGLMEIADVYVLNKADQPGISDLKSQVASLLHVRRKTDWRPPVLETTANTGEGIGALLDAIEDHAAHLAGGEGRARARAGARAGALRVARSLFDRHLEQVSDAMLDGPDDGTFSEVEVGRELAERAARDLLDGSS